MRRGGGGKGGTLLQLQYEPRFLASFKSSKRIVLVYLWCEISIANMYLGFSPISLFGVVIHLMLVNTLKCLYNSHKQMLAEVLLRAQSLAVFTLETDYPF